MYVASVYMNPVNNCMNGTICYTECVHLTLKQKYQGMRIIW